MKRFSPQVMSVDYGEMNGTTTARGRGTSRPSSGPSWLVSRLWREVESRPAYRGRTRVLILPDHGRQLEGPGSPGFIPSQRLSPGQGADKGCRRVWMLAIGPGSSRGA